MLILQRVRLPNGEEACEVRHDMVGANETQMCYSYADVAVLDALVAAPVKDKSPFTTDYWGRIEGLEMI